MNLVRVHARPLFSVYRAAEGQSVEDYSCRMDDLIWHLDDYVAQEHESGCALLELDQLLRASGYAEFGRGISANESAADVSAMRIGGVIVITPRRVELDVSVWGAVPENPCGTSEGVWERLRSDDVQVCPPSRESTDSLW